MNKDARTKAASSRSGPKARKSTVRKDKSAPRSNRTLTVLAGLVVGLACTGALLKALAPPPLTPEVATTLSAVSEAQAIDRVLETPMTVKAGRWHWIYIHQSLTAAGDSRTLGRAEGLPDHFLIGNGNPIGDGVIQTQPRWSQQMAAGTLEGLETISPDCLSICVVGDFNHTAPTSTQQERLLELVSALQQQLGIPSEHILLGGGVAEPSVAGIGKYFPVADFRSKLSQ